jgi:hypothetical protein
MMVNLTLVRVQVLTAASTKMTAFWDIALCSLIEMRYTDVFEVHSVSTIRAITLMMETTRTSETR